MLNFLDKDVDIVIMDMTLRRKTPRFKLPSTKFTRSQQLIDKTTKKSGLIDQRDSALLQYRFTSRRYECRAYYKETSGALHKGGRSK